MAESKNEKDKLRDPLLELQGSMKKVVLAEWSTSPPCLQLLNYLERYQQKSDLDA